MKKTMLYLAAAGFMFASCQKDEETTATNGVGAKASTTSSVSPLPGSFTKKVLIEELTGQNEGTAPYADRFFDSYVLNTAGGKICVASLYNSGQLTNLETNRLISLMPMNSAVDGWLTNESTTSTASFRPSTPVRPAGTTRS